MAQQARYATAAADAVLTTYGTDAKVKRAHELIAGGPTSFVGDVLS